MAKERICLLDKKSYKYCPNCGGDSPSETWRNLYCSENCYKIATLWQKHRDKKITDLETKRELLKLDLTSLDSYNDLFKSDIIEIMNTEIKPVVTEPTIHKTIKKKSMVNKIVNDDLK